MEQYNTKLFIRLNKGAAVHALIFTIFSEQRFSFCTRFETIALLAQPHPYLYTVMTSLVHIRPEKKHIFTFKYNLM